MRFSITDQNTVLGVDYQISTYLVQFMNGQTSAFVPVQIIDDSRPEFNESFVIRLEENSLTGGAKLGSPKECVVTIPENDYPYGLIGIFQYIAIFTLLFILWENMVWQLFLHRFIQCSLPDIYFVH